jgi:hypothetical protein
MAANGRAVKSFKENQQNFLRVNFFEVVAHQAPMLDASFDRQVTTAFLHFEFEDRG